MDEEKTTYYVSGKCLINWLKDKERIKKKYIYKNKQ